MSNTVNPKDYKFSYGEKPAHVRKIKMLVTIHYGSTPLMAGKKYNVSEYAAQTFVSRGLANYVDSHNTSRS